MKRPSLIPSRQDNSDGPFQSWLGVQDLDAGEGRRHWLVSDTTFNGAPKISRWIQF